MSRTLPIRAGVLSARVVDDRLRDVRLCGIPVLDSVYVAVRDAGWGTIPGELIAYRAEQRDGITQLSFVMQHLCGPIDFRWNGSIVAGEDEIRFEMDGLAATEFVACRIGFCLLHPLGLLGREVAIETPDGLVRGEFLERISAVQVFENVTAMSYDVAPGTGIAVRLAGDLFETEDHRNWTDAGWKTYCTPLRSGFPFTVRAGQRLQQSVSIVAHGRIATPPVADNETAEAVITAESSGPLPTIGFGAAPPTEQVPAITSQIKGVKPAHIVAEIDLAGEWLPVLEHAAAQAIALNTALDVWLVGNGPVLDDAAEALVGITARLGRVAIFDPATHITPPDLSRRLREFLARRGCIAQVGGGSRAAFAELNAMTLPLDELDFVTYSICPQLHHTDDESIMDTVAAQRHTVRDALRLAAGRPVVVGPITLGLRIDPHRPARPTDARQWTAFNAAWTVGSIASLAGATALTYFQTAGGHGLLRRGEMSPVCQVFRTLARFQGATIARAEVDRTDIAVLALQRGGGQWALVANLRGEPRSVRVHSGARSVAVDLDGYGTALAEVPGH